MKLKLIIFLLHFLTAQDTIKIDFGKDKDGKYWNVVNDGVMGIKFIFAAKKSSNLNSKWIKI